jgi:TatD DNase family protein
VIDFHCHLDLYPDPHRMAEECRQRHMYVLSMTTAPSVWRLSSKLSIEGDRIRTALGLHPQVAHERRTELDLFDELLGQTRYVGEIGLDGAPELRDSWSIQLEVFDHILDACRRAGGRILSIHSRRASKAVLERLARYQGAGTPILHWFSGSPRELDQAIKLGCWFSVGPAMLRGERGRDLASHMPRDRVLTESDGPFAQMDGKPALPWDVQRAEEMLADVWSVSLDQSRTMLRDNLRSLVTSGAVNNARDVRE